MIVRVETNDLEQLWADFAEARTEENLRALLVAYLPCLERMAIFFHSKLPRYLRSHVTADDLMSDGCIGLFRGLSLFSLEGAACFETWIRKRVHGCFLNCVQRANFFTSRQRLKAKEAGRALPDVVALGDSVDVVFNPEFAESWDEICDRSLLSARERQELQLFFVEGKTYREICDIMQIGESQRRQLRRSSIALLRKKNGVDSVEETSIEEDQVVPLLRRSGPMRMTDIVQQTGANRTHLYRVMKSKRFTQVSRGVYALASDEKAEVT